MYVKQQIDKIYMIMNSNNNYPPYILKAFKCTTWPEITKEILPEVVYKADRRLQELPIVFDNPVVCRLYDALYAEARSEYAWAIAAEYWQYIEALPDKATVVEVGCGPGTILLRLAKIAKEKGKQVNFTGWDISSEMVYLAEHHREVSKLDNVSFILADSSDRKCQTYLRDTHLLLSRNLLSWVDEPDREIMLWRRALQLGSKVISREVRRDITIEQFKLRMAETCQFSLSGQLLAYPLDAYLISYLRAFTADEHSRLLQEHFSKVYILPVENGLKSDLGKTEDAESQIISEKV